MLFRYVLRIKIIGIDQLHPQHRAEGDRKGVVGGEPIPKMLVMTFRASQHDGKCHHPVFPVMLKQPRCEMEEYVRRVGSTGCCGDQVILIWHSAQLRRIESPRAWSYWTVHAVAALLISMAAHDAIPANHYHPLLSGKSVPTCLRLSCCYT